jgi:hypothetical protein
MLHHVTKVWFLEYERYNGLVKKSDKSVGGKGKH